MVIIIYIRKQDSRIMQLTHDQSHKKFAFPRNIDYVLEEFKHHPDKFAIR